MPHLRFQGLINRLFPNSTDQSPNDGHQLARLVRGKVITGAEYNSASRRPARYAPTPTQSERLMRIQTWLRGGGIETDKILLLHGLVGVGKTFLMQNFVEIETEAPNPTLRATLFLSHPEQLSHVLVTIAYQLASQSEDYQRYLVELFRFAYPKLMETSMDEQFEKLFVKPFARLGKMILQNHEDTNLIVIDGLDQCKGDIEHFFRLIAQFTYSNSNPPLVWLVSSRSKFTSVDFQYQQLELPREHTVELLRRDQKLLTLSLPGRLAIYLVPNIEFDLKHFPPSVRLSAVQTRILHNILSWVNDPTHRKRQVLWVHGYVGVGKSAVMRALARDEPKSLGAKIFFSGTNTPHDSQYVLITIAYQLSEKYEPYKEYIADLLERDPVTFEESMEHQFVSFIQRPLGERNLLRRFGTILITLDGLDQLPDELSKRDLIHLICRFSREYPTASLIWIITSQPERYIQDAFSESGSSATYWEMKIDPDVKGVEEYLRVEFQTLRTQHNYDRQWPTKADSTKFGQCASGLFIVAVMLMQCVHNLHRGDPDSSLQRTLHLISHAISPKDKNQPFLVLKALFTGIYAEIAQHHPPGTQRLLTLLLPGMEPADFVLACNWAGISQDLSQMFYLILDIPASAEEASRRPPRAIHSSFLGYLTNRFNFSVEEQRALETNISILKQAYNPDEHVVQTSRLQLSWPHQDGQNIQDGLFEWSLTWLMDTGHKFLEDAPTLLSDLGPFFQDLDYRRNIKIFGRRDNLIRGHIFHENYYSFMQSWGVQSEVFPVSDLERNRFRWNEEACVLIIARGIYHLPEKEVRSRNAWTACFSTLGRKGFRRCIFDEELQLRIMHHVSTPAADLNTCSAMFIGRGDRACVLIQIIGVMDMEAYFIPYDRPVGPSQFIIQ